MIVHQNHVLEENASTSRITLFCNLSMVPAPDNAKFTSAQAVELFDQVWEEAGTAIRVAAAATASAVASAARAKHQCTDFICPESLDTMVDPVKCSDGTTYCRYSAYCLIDSSACMPGCEAGVFEIRGAIVYLTRSLLI